LFSPESANGCTEKYQNAHVACDFGHHAILLDVKANFAKRGTPIQSQKLSWVLPYRGLGEVISGAAACRYGASARLAAPTPQAATQSRRRAA
jgi:hypothetical protein